MNARIRAIVTDALDCACSSTQAKRAQLIRDLEAHHDAAVTEAAAGALAARDALDRALGRGASVDTAGEPDDERARR